MTLGGEVTGARAGDSENYLGPIAKRHNQGPWRPSGEGRQVSPARGGEQHQYPEHTSVGGTAWRARPGSHRSA